MAKIHENYMINFLDRNKTKSYIGTELKKILISNFKDLSEENARKVISNCYKKKAILSTEPVTFCNNQYVYFSVKAKEKYSLLKSNIEKYKPQLFRVIYALSRKSGIISLNELYNISGVSISNGSHNVSFDKLMDDLNYLDIAELFESDGLKYIRFKNKGMNPEGVSSVKEDLKDKNLLLSLFSTWLIRSNIVDGKKFCFLGEPNNYEGISRNDYYWDAFGFTNTVGIGTLQKDFQTIVVIDFFHKNKYEEYDFQGFNKKVECLIFSVKGKKRKVLPIVIATEFSPVAKTLIQKHNYMCFNLDSILGKNAVKISRQYRESIEKMEDIITKKDIITESDQTIVLKNVSNTCNLIQTNGNEVNFGNLKGTLFEYLMYPVLSRIFNQNGTRIIHNFAGSVDNEKFECDYRIETEKENIFIELKGYNREYVIPLGKCDKENNKPKKQTIKWFLKKYELAKKFVGNERKSKFCYITTSTIEDKAKKVMSQRKKEKAEILDYFYEYDSLIELLNNYKLKKEIEVIKQFFGL